MSEKPDSAKTPQKPSVYLWLCCEGWMKFGPFEWLRFDDERLAILGPDGEEVAKKSGGQWRVPEEKWQGWGFPTSTPYSLILPRLNQRSILLRDKWRIRSAQDSVRLF